MCSAASTYAQQTPTVPQDVTEQRAPLTETAVALDVMGRVALAGRLRTTTLNGALDSPVQNVRLVVENRSGFFFTYVSGWATFYDGVGTRCGEGLFALDALAPGESVETDTPGLRLTCAPASWRIVANNLLTRISDTAKPSEPIRLEPSRQPANLTTEPPRFININVNGIEYRVPLGSTLNIPVNEKQVTITVLDKP
jgi:hypothetical protein